MSMGFLRRPVILGTLVAVVIGVTGCQRDVEPGASEVRLSLIEILGGGDTVGYRRAIDPRTFDFPTDHGSHLRFRTEWWYVTGNVSTEDGRDFGFHFTIFRSALAPEHPGGPSKWSTNQAYMGHFAVTDIEGKEFRAEERFARGAAGLAGAAADSMHVWLGDWVLETAAADTSTHTTFPLSLVARGEGMALELSLDAGKAVVLQGDRGLSRKGPEPGNASYYYSRSRMPASGRVVFGPDTVEVRGLAWLDREWSTSGLSEDQVGWDWFALQLDDGWDVMVYQLRLKDGSADRWSYGVLIDPAGNRVELEWGSDLILESNGSWASPIDGAVYPSGWRLRVPSRDWDLAIEPAILDQELDLAFRYWEGSVRVEGLGEGGRPVAGRGYAELTGYAGTAPTR